LIDEFGRRQSVLRELRLNLLSIVGQGLVFVNAEESAEVRKLVQTLLILQISKRVVDLVLDLEQVLRSQAREAEQVERGQAVVDLEPVDVVRPVGEL